MKTISFELAKRLNDAGLLKNINTDYFWYKCNETGNYEIVNRCDIVGDRLYICKAPTLEEVIELLKQYTKKQNFKIETTDYMSLWSIYGQTTPIFRKETLLEAIEEMLKFLLDNNLLTK